LEPLLLWGMGLLLAALLVLVLEVFIPSAGMLSVLSGALAVGGLVCLYRHDTLWGVTGTLVVVILGPVIVSWGFRILPSTPMGRKMLFGEEGHEKPAITAEPPIEFDALVGSVGEALTDLRPVGVARFDTLKLDVLSQTSYVRAGTRVRVTDVEGTLVKVRPIDA
jgi:membrane-bound serine protease (ClpP class)